MGPASAVLSVPAHACEPGVTGMFCRLCGADLVVDAWRV